jgi:hypothetical protein
MTLLFKDYFQRFGGPILVLFVGIASLRFFASSLDNETHLSLWLNPFGLDAGLVERLLSMVVVFSNAATIFFAANGYSLALVGFMMAMALIGEKWPRVALALPVSRKVIALTLWIEFVPIPSLLVTIGACIVQFIGVSDALDLDESTVSLPKILLASICSTGIACFFVQTVDALAARYAGAREPDKLDLKLGGSILFATCCFGLILGLLFLAFEHWPDLRIRDVALIIVALGMTGLSFRNRQSLVYLFESFRVKYPRKELPPVPKAPRDTVWRSPGFLGSYTRVARIVLVATLVLCSLSLPFSTIRMWPLTQAVFGAYARILTSPNFFVFEEPDGVFFLFLLSGILILMSFICTPPLRVCRVLPLSAFQLHLRLLACPAIIFTVCTLTALPFILFFTAWDVMHALAILYLAFGFVIFINGLDALITQIIFEMALPLFLILLFCSFFLFGPVMIDFVEAVVRAPSALAILGSLFFVLGNVAWYRGIAYASPAYRISLQREHGKIVL